MPFKLSVIDGGAVKRGTVTGRDHRAGLYVGLLAGPGGLKIEPALRGGAPSGALWIGRITGSRDPAIG